MTKFERFLDAHNDLKRQLSDLNRENEKNLDSK